MGCCTLNKKRQFTFIGCIRMKQRLEYLMWTGDTDDGKQQRTYLIGECKGLAEQERK